MPYKVGFSNKSASLLSAVFRSDLDSSPASNDRGTFSNPLSNFSAVAGDVVILHMVTRYNSITPSEASTPSGWNKIMWTSVGSVSGTDVYHTYWKKLTAGDTSSISFDTASGAPSNKFWIALVISGSRRTPQVIGTPSSEVTGGTPSNQSISMGAVIRPAVVFAGYGVMGPNGAGTDVTDGESRLRIGGSDADDADKGQAGQASVTNIRAKYKLFQKNTALQDMIASVNDNGLANCLVSFALQV